MKFTRILNLHDLLKKKSFFLFGPRATGKSYLVREQLAGLAVSIDLLKSDYYLRLSESPGVLEAIIRAGLESAKQKWVVIDEVQKIPALLDEVHHLIETQGYHFLLTGSSARKLKHGQANLLAGRAWTARMFPLTWAEIPKLDLYRYLRYGGLPSVYSSENPEEELHAYVRTYLYEEIQAEGLVRKLPQFSRFLTATAHSNGQLLNFANIAGDSGVPASTVTEYYNILQDTLIGFILEPWVKSKKRKAISTAKFYFFDTGVAHALSGTKALDRNSNLYGVSFEQWIGMELRAYLDYKRIREDLCFWRSTHQQEVDYLIGDHTAIEVKATRRVSTKDLKGLQALEEERIFKNYWLVSEDPIETRRGSIKCVPYFKFLDQLWGGKVIGPACGQGLVLLFLLPSLIASAFAMASEPCREIPTKTIGKVRIQVINTLKGGCSVLVSEAGSGKTRQYSFRVDGSFQVGNTVGASGIDSKDNYSHVFFFFPVGRTPRVDEMTNGNIAVFTAAGQRVELDSATARLKSITGLAFSEDKTVEAKGKSGVTIKRSEKLYLDTRNATGKPGYQIKDASSVFHDPSGKSCEVINTEIFHYEYVTVKEKGKDKTYLVDVTLKHKTNLELAKFLRKRCPDLDVRSLEITPSKQVGTPEEDKGAITAP